MCRRILVVENRRSLADYVALLVERRGHQVRIACDGEAALVVAQNFNPEVILLDRTVPDIDGCPVAVALCAVAKHAHIRTFVLSVSDDVKDREFAPVVGAQKKDPVRANYLHLARKWPV
jgi:DNA-binding response OmpR family regulator